METIDKIRRNNPDREIRTLHDESFHQYGRVLSVKADSWLMDYLESKADFPDKGNVYVASSEEMEKSTFKGWVEDYIYGGLKCQIGYCNGLISHINGYEFHQCSEVFIAGRDCILALILPHRPLWDSEPYRIEEGHLFFVPKGRVLELYPMTGHFSPIRVHEEGYRTVIILQKGTNEAIENHKLGSDHKDLAFAKNKWLYVHEDRMDLVEKGAYLHVLGDNSPIQVI